MFRIMFRHLFRPVAFVLIAAQLLLSAPMVNALPSAGSGEMPCAEQMSGDRHIPDCPCCPDGVKSLAGCLTACMPAAAIAPSALIVGASTSPVESSGAVIAPVVYLADPPLKPPPIA
jgi:hypothetical protein